MLRWGGTVRNDAPDNRMVAAINARNQRHSTRSAVTGVLSRAGALELLDATYPDQRLEPITGVIAFDLDGFQHINHSYGFAVGDRVLDAVTERLQSRLPLTDRLARMGGDEFLVILHGSTSSDVVRLIVTRLLRAVSAPLTLDGHDCGVNASAGVAMAGAASSGLDLLHQAQAAVRRAKQKGPGSVRFSTPHDRAELSLRLQRERELRNGFERRELMLNYQPEFDLSRRTILGVEALARWDHPDRGMLSAEYFIGIAEESGLISRIGTWVLGEAMRDAERWHETGRRFVIRVNLSARQLVDDAIVIDLRNALGAHHVEPENVCLEVTESHLIHQVGRSAKTLQRLKALGVQVALDDFGTGYSSMSYVKDLPIDALKIDRSFVAGLPHNRSDRAIVSSIVQLGREIGLDVVAEGIETAAQLACLLELGCTRGQGFYLARPMPAADVSRTIESHVGRVAL